MVLVWLWLELLNPWSTCLCSSSASGLSSVSHPAPTKSLSFVKSHIFAPFCAPSTAVLPANGPAKTHASPAICANLFAVFMIGPLLAKMSLPSLQMSVWQPMTLIGENAVRASRNNAANPASVAIPHPSTRRYSDGDCFSIRRNASRKCRTSLNPHAVATQANVSFGWFSISLRA